MKIMTKTLLLASLLITSQLFAQIIWEEPIDIATSTFGKTRPIIKLMNDSTPIILWSNVSSKVQFVVYAFRHCFKIVFLRICSSI